MSLLASSYHELSTNAVMESLETLSVEAKSFVQVEVPCRGRNLARQALQLAAQQCAAHPQAFRCGAQLEQSLLLIVVARQTGADQVGNFIGVIRDLDLARLVVDEREHELEIGGEGLSGAVQWRGEIIRRFVGVVDRLYQCRGVWPVMAHGGDMESARAQSEQGETAIWESLVIRDAGERADWSGELVLVRAARQR